MNSAIFSRIQLPQVFNWKGIDISNLSLERCRSHVSNVRQANNCVKNDCVFWKSYATIIQCLWEFDTTYFLNSDWSTLNCLLTKEVFVNNYEELQMFCDINLQMLNQHAPQKIKYVRGNQMPFMTKQLSKKKWKDEGFAIRITWKHRVPKWGTQLEHLFGWLSKLMTRPFFGEI